MPYIAGLFDGEGSVGIYTNGQGHGRTLRVQITQTVTPQSTALFAATKARWGGSLCSYNKALRRPAWNWQVSAKTGYVFLRDIRPWLVLKADQADVVLAWWPKRATPLRDSRGRRLPALPETRAADQAAQRLLRDLKQADAA